MKSSGGSWERRQNRLANSLALLEKDTGVVNVDRPIIRRFAEMWVAKGFTVSRTVKLVYSMRKLSSLLQKPFGDTTKEDIVSLIGRIEETDFSDRSKYDLKVILKTFYKWYKGEDESYPKEVSWIKPRHKKGRHTLPEELLTEDEVRRMAGMATGPRDKALVLVLYESGCRAGELLSLRLKNVQFDEFGAVLRVTGKTGDRRVRIIQSAPALKEWLKWHHSKDNPEAPLWPPRPESNHRHGRATDHRSVLNVLKLLAQKARVNKRVYPHLFRHSRATALANKLTEAQMKEYFGWTQASDMASVYVHLSGRDVDNALIEINKQLHPAQTELAEPSDEEIKTLLAANPQLKRYLLKKIFEYRDSLSLI